VSSTRVRLFAAVSLFGIALASAVPIPGYAQDDLRKQGDKACRGDGPRLCKKVLGQGDMAVLQCFQQNKARLSSTCRKFLTDVGQLY